MLEGAQQGKWTALYANGERSQEGFYEKGRRDGLWTEWFENGRTRVSGLYKPVASMASGFISSVQAFASFRKPIKMVAVMVLLAGGMKMDWINGLVHIQGTFSLDLGLNTTEIAARSPKAISQRAYVLESGVIGLRMDKFRRKGSSSPEIRSKSGVFGIPRGFLLADLITEGRPCALAPSQKRRPAP